MDRWWNVTFAVVVPFDTREEAEAASFDSPTMDRLIDVAEDLFGKGKTIGWAHIEEATDENA